MPETVEGQMEYVEAGAVDFGVDYRRLGDDEGASIHVFGKVDGKRTELLRFDCFDKDPHYHYGPEGKNERLNLDCTAEGDPIPWVLSLAALETDPYVSESRVS